MKLPIILIGPVSAGKSSIAESLSQKLHVPETPLDYIAGYYYVRQGVDLIALAKILNEKTVIEYVDFMREYELNAALAVCEDFSQSIISFGAGHAYYTKQDQIDRLLSLKGKTPNIFLILPSEDNNESEKILADRIDNNRKNVPEEKRSARNKMNHLFIESTSMKQLTHHVVYMNGRSIEEASQEIITLLK